MVIETIHNKDILFEFLQKEPGLQIYLIGDLDDFFWPKTQWFALKEGDEIKSLALLYSGNSPPALLCFQKKGSEFALRLLKEIKYLLPPRYYAHLGEGFADALGCQNILKHFGLNYKMVLYEKIPNPGYENIRRLNKYDLSEIRELYSAAYPHNWFDSHMLESGKYLGYFIKDELAGIAGIHVYSSRYRVAALGNIAILPVYRNQHIGYKLTAALCYDLQKNVDIIGLNVWSDNDYAIRLYKKLGFKIEGTYEECLMKNEPVQMIL